MRFLLLHHESEAELAARPAEAVESALAFMLRFEDELASRSELEWSEVLGSDERAEFVTPGGQVELGQAPGGAPLLRRVWAVRVDSEERARYLAGELADGIAARIELRECLPGAQRP